MIIERYGNVFDLDNKYSLVQCISRCATMDAGIAKEYCRRYPELRGKVESYLREFVGSRVVLCDMGDRYIINLVTKNKFYNKPSYVSMRLAVQEMVELCKIHNITNLGMSHIGCNLDRLEWEKVKEILNEETLDSGINILVVDRNYGSL